MYQKAHFHNALLLRKYVSILLPLASFFTINRSFKMRYCMNFYLKWHRNYAWSKLELRYLLNKKQTSNFDHAQFLHQLRQKFIQYLILKLQSIVKKGGKGQRMFAFLCSKIALCSWDFWYIKCNRTCRHCIYLNIIQSSKCLYHHVTHTKKSLKIILQITFSLKQIITKHTLIGIF